MAASPTGLLRFPLACRLRADIITGVHTPSTPTIQGGSTMSRTLKLLDHVFRRGRHLQKLGRHQDAFALFQRLSQFGNLPHALAAATETRLARHYLRRRKYRLASHHLRTALCHRPENARVHYLLGHALASARQPDLKAALGHYNRSLALRPNQPRCRSAYGVLLVRMGWSEEGIRQLRQAAEQAAGQVVVLDRVVTGLCVAGRIDEARDILLAARFRQPHDARVQYLWNRWKYRMLRKSQEAALRQKADSADHHQGPVLLPFAPVSKAGVRGGKILRRDPASRIPAPQSRLAVHRPEQRHAQ
jgi:Tfp pilus assembly protein PilF